MRRFKSNKEKKNKIKRRTILSIIILTVLLFNYVNKQMLPKLLEITKENIKVYDNKIIMTFVDGNVLKSTDLSKLLEVTKLEDGSVVAVNYNLKDAYTLLQNVSNQVSKGIDSVDYGDIDNYHNPGKDEMIFFYPIALAWNKVYLSNLGPKIPIKINLLSSMVSSLKTESKNYGINNTLIEMYIEVNITSKIVMPTVSEEVENNYRILIGSLMVQGKVPSYLNGVIDQKGVEVTS